MRFGFLALRVIHMSPSNSKIVGIALALLLGTTAASAQTLGPLPEPEIGTGNANFSITSGNTINDLITMSNTTTGVQDSGVLLSSLAPKASPTFTGPVTYGSASSAVFGTTGVSLIGNAYTQTDSVTAAGTVATVYGSLIGANTFATAGNAITITNGFNTYFKNPIAGANVTGTNLWALGADSLVVMNGTTTEFSANSVGAVSLNASLTFLNNGAAILLRNQNTAIFSPANAQVQFGSADSAGAPVAQTLSVQSASGVSNTAGANTTLDLISAGTGTGVAGILTINCAPHSTTGTTKNAYSACLTLNGDTLAETLAGTLTVNTIGSGTGDFLCSPINGGLITQGVTTCVASDKRVKNDLGIVTPDMAVARIMASPDEHLYTYKSQRYGASGIHGGWFAQDIQKNADYHGTVYKSGPTPLTPDGELTFDKGELGPDTTTAVKWLVMKEREQQTEITRLGQMRQCKNFYIRGLVCW